MQHRRQFLKSAAAVTLAAGSVLGANDKVNMAIVGLGGRGRDHIASFAAIPGARIVALCDVNQTAREQGAVHARKVTGSDLPTYRDLREVLALPNVDAVSLATPNHWHALGTIWACQAGKDVYVEKPASHNILEGRAMVAAARKYGRIVQVGTQNRSDPLVQRAIELLHTGAIGKVHLAKGFCYKRRKSIGRKPDTPVPSGLDWDAFLGPAPMRPFNENRYRYNWHWFWDTGNGDMGNQGIHEMDIARWGLNVNTWPVHAVATGGKFLYDDDQETPNMQLANFDYNGAQLTFEVRGLITGADTGLEAVGPNVMGDIFYGSDGYMIVSGGGYSVALGEKHEPGPAERPREGARSSTTLHMENFVSAVRSRRIGDLHADVQTGVDSTNLCHLANVSYRTGRRLELTGQQTVRNDAEANALFTRQYRAPWVLPEIPA